MPRSGLNRQRVIEAAMELIEQRGVEDFSMRALAVSAALLIPYLKKLTRRMAA